MESRTSTVSWVNRLLALNLLLQLFDGVATYHGFAVWGEGNPMLRAAIAELGLGVALLLAKSLACALLVVIHAAAADRVVVPGMTMCAVFYGSVSLVPWLRCFLIASPA